MPRKMPLPRGWKHRVRSSVLHILALSQYTLHLNLSEFDDRHAVLQASNIAGPVHRIASVQAIKIGGCLSHRGQRPLEEAHDQRSDTGDYKP